jgi:hypothetical protein
MLLEAPPPPAPKAAAVLAASRPFAPVSGAPPCVASRASKMWMGKGSRGVVTPPLKASPTTRWCRIPARKSGRATRHPAGALEARILPRFLEVTLRGGRICILGVRVLEISFNGVRHDPVSRRRRVHRVGAPERHCPCCLIVRRLNPSLSDPHHTVRTENTEARGLLNKQEVPHVIS